MLPNLVAQWDVEKNGALTPKDVTAWSDVRVWWRCPIAEDHRWEAPVGHRAGAPGCPFCRGFRASRTNSLASLFPGLAAQLHPGHNGGLRAADVVAGSERRLWWRCPAAEDHEWEAPVAHRARSPGCPFCRGFRASRTNSLASLFPALAAQLHAGRNGRLRPEEVVAGSHQPLWWSCAAARDHQWQTSPYNRVRSPGCPFCSGQRASSTNNLATVNPALAALWHPSRNSPLTARDITPAADKVIWWKCPAGKDHEWQARIERQRRGKCPFCRNARPSVTNSLAATHPEMARFWDHSKNGKLTPRDVVAGSTKAVFWRCPTGPDHAWKGYIFDVAQKEGCPFCRNWRLSVTNCLATLAPEIARHLHPTKNGKLTARDVTATSNREVWWVCDEDPKHVWKGKVSKQFRHGDRWLCVICMNRRVSTSNSLAARFPKLAAEWDRRKNGELTPANVTFGFTGTVWWRCPAARDHTWQARVNVRVRWPRCPFCTGRRVSVTNSLAKLFPKVAREWSSARNRELIPADVLAASKDLVWWRCPLGHEWRASVCDRTAGGKACPLCADASIHRVPRRS